MSETVLVCPQPGTIRCLKGRVPQFKNFHITYHPLMNSKILGEVRYRPHATLSISSLSHTAPFLSFVVWYNRKWIVDVTIMNIETTPELENVPDLVRHIYAEVADWVAGRITL